MPVKCNCKPMAQQMAQTLVWVALLAHTASFAAEGQLSQLAEQASRSIDSGIRYFHSTSVRGGYVYYFTPDLTERWGEGKVDADTIEVQPPGTPAVGMAFLEAYRVTKQQNHLQAALDAAMALAEGQNDLGGWGHTIRFDRPKNRRISFDDDQTQSAIRFLMAVDREVDSEDLARCIEKALGLMMASQLDNGGWPHMYPLEGDYHDYATFNDRGINRCIDVMIEAVRYYDKPEHRECLDKVGRFLMVSQLPPPQPGWAQQYNEYLQPAWARDFEPPAVCPLVTVTNLQSLMDLYDFTGRSQYLKPIPDAIRWLEAIRLPNGRWARFVEMGTGKPLYYDRDRIRVDSPDELHIERRLGYGYENDLSSAIDRAKRRYEGLRADEGRSKPEAEKPASAGQIRRALQERSSAVRQIIDAQDEQGRWITRNDRYRHYVPNQRWNGEYTEKDRISSSVFIRNLRTLCDFLETYRQLETIESGR